MLGWSINLFRIRGIQLAVHLSFFLLLAYAAEMGWQEAGWEGLLWSVATLLAFFTCVVLHELGHSFTAMRFGIRVRRILLMPIGGMAEFDEIPRQPSRELLITLAGPAVNFVIAAALSCWVGFPQGWPWNDYEYAANARGFAGLVMAWNLLMGCFNLVPIFPMDGGRILRAILTTRLPYVRATFWAASVGKVLAIVAALLALFVWHLWLTAVLFGFIYFVGEAEYRAVKQREWEDARWREVLERVYPHLPPPIDEPPLLPR